MRITFDVLIRAVPEQIAVSVFGLPWTWRQKVRPKRCYLFLFLFLFSFSFCSSSFLFYFFSFSCSCSSLFFCSPPPPPPPSSSSSSSFFFLNCSYWWNLASSQTVLHCSQSCDICLQFLKPIFFLSSPTDSSHLQLGFPTCWVPSGLGTVTFLQEFQRPNVCNFRTILSGISTASTTYIQHFLINTLYEITYQNRKTTT